MYTCIHTEFRRFTVSIVYRASLVAQLVENPLAVAGDLGLIPGSGRSPREGSGNPLQYFCLENSIGRGYWQAAVHGITKIWTQLSD